VFTAAVIVTEDGRIGGFSYSVSHGYAWDVYAWTVKSSGKR